VQLPLDLTAWYTRILAKDAGSRGSNNTMFQVRQSLPRGAQKSGAALRLVSDAPSLVADPISGAG